MATESPDDDGDDLAPRLCRYRAQELKERLVFSVDNMAETDPNEAGPMVVSVDGDRIEIHFSGDSRHRWSGKWADLRWLIERIAAEQIADKREKDARLVLQKARRERKRKRLEAGQRQWRDLGRVIKASNNPLEKSRRNPGKPDLA